MPVTSAIEMCGISNQACCNYYEYFENLVADNVSENIEKNRGGGKMSLWRLMNQNLALGSIIEAIMSKVHG